MRVSPGTLLFGIGIPILLCFIPPPFSPFSAPLPQFPCLPRVHPGFPPVPRASVTSLHFISCPRHFWSQVSAPRVNHCKLCSNCSLSNGFLGPARVLGAQAELGRVEVYFSADQHLPVEYLSQDKSPAPFSLALSPYKNNSISKEQITPSAHNRCQELFLF